MLPPITPSQMRDEGIVIDGSYNNKVYNNTIADCSGYGIEISGSENNTMYANVLIGNNGATSIYDEGCVQAYDDSDNIWNSTTMGNYWSDWQTPDTELLYGIVDVPYVIDGGAGAQDNLPMVMGGVPPAISIDAPLEGSYNNTGSVTVKWTASDAIYGIAKIEISTDGTTWTDVTGTTSDVLALSDGSHTVYVRATNNADGVNTVSVTFTVDKVKPVLNIVTPVSGSLYNTTALNITWTAGDSGSGLNNFWVSIDGGVWTDVAKDLSYSLSSLADGSHIIAVKCEDKAGNWNESSASFDIDTLAPTITEHSPIGKDVSRNASIGLAFSERMNESSVGIVASGVSGTIAWSGNNMTFTPTSTLAYDTTYTVDVTGKDLAGNAIEYSWSFTTMKNEGVIEGVIKDANGNPLANATVTLSNGMVTTTDLNGHFIFENVTAGTYTLNATKAGFAPITQTVSASAGQTNYIGNA